MIDGLNGLMAEIDKFKDSVKDTTALSENLSLNSEVIKKNTQRIDELKVEIGETIKKSETKISFDIEAKKMEMLEEIKTERQRIEDFKDKIVEAMRVSEEKLSAEIKTIKTETTEKNTITHQNLKLLNNNLVVSMGISFFGAICAIIILILNIN